MQETNFVHKILVSPPEKVTQLHHFRPKVADKGFQLNISCTNRAIICDDVKAHSMTRPLERMWYRFFPCHFDQSLVENDGKSHGILTTFPWKIRVIRIGCLIPISFACHFDGIQILISLKKLQKLSDPDSNPGPSDLWPDILTAMPLWHIWKIGE